MVKAAGVGPGDFSFSSLRSMVGAGKSVFGGSAGCGWGCGREDTGAAGLLRAPALARRLL